MSDKVPKRTPGAYVTPLGAWALALGTAIGWGSLVVTSNTYLTQAGPVGSIIGLIIGAAVMLVIARNYHYMINCFPDAGGAYAYAKETFGYDYGFLVSWFLMLTYAAILWANMTSLPLFARYFFGPVFQVGKLYTIFGYDVYSGEILLTIAALVLTGLIIARYRTLTIRLMIGLALMLSACITICFILTSVRRGDPLSAFEPAFVPGSGSVRQIVAIACISPWAFIGFENISHSAEEFTFSRSKVFRILSAAIISATALYVFVLILSVSAYPAEYGSWIEYIRDLGNLSGIKALPAFYAAQYYLGSSGITLLVLALFGLIVTSLIGNSIALSRLIYALAKDSILPARYSELNSALVPAKAIRFLVLFSLPIPLLGRTAIGWIVDVTTIGATLIYAFVSASAYKIAKVRSDENEQRYGLAGVFITIGIEAYLLIPNLFRAGSMEKETFFLFVVWGILGFIFFRNILRRDKEGRFGKSLIVWIALLSLVLLIALIWMSQSMMSTTNQAMENIHEHYLEAGAISDAQASDEAFIDSQLAQIRSSNTRTVLGATGMFAFALIILLTNYTYMNRKTKESEEALGHVRAIAYTDPLTGVKNKRAFAEKEKEFDELISQEHCDDFSIVVCDVNGLKYINDTYGHKAGDEYIRSACRLICEIFQHSPVFRIGGDEFVVILTGRDHDNRASLLEELGSRVEANIGTDNVIVASGISDYESGSDRTVHDVFERADSLMYIRKTELKEMGARSRV